MVREALRALVADPWEGFGRARGLKRPSKTRPNGAPIGGELLWRKMLAEFSGMAAETVRKTHRHVYGSSWRTGGKSLGCGSVTVRAAPEWRREHGRVTQTCILLDVRNDLSRALREQLDTVDRLLEEARRVRDEVNEQIRRVTDPIPSDRPYTGPERRQWPRGRRGTAPYE